MVVDRFAVADVHRVLADFSVPSHRERLGAEARVVRLRSRRVHAAIERLTVQFPNLAIYSQPTRTREKYPLRIWLLADGLLTMDTGSGSLSRNKVVGQCFEHGFAHCTARPSRYMRAPRPPPATSKTTLE